MGNFDFRNQVTRESLKIRFYFNMHEVFFKGILFIRTPRLRKAQKQEVPRHHAQAHMQTHLRIPPTKVFISFRLPQCIFHHFLNTISYFRYLRLDRWSYDYWHFWARCTLVYEFTVILFKRTSSQEVLWKFVFPFLADFHP